MKTIVTGATGFLGYNLAKRLLELGFIVVALGRNTEKGKLLTDIGCEFIQVDLTDKDKLLQIFNGADYVFHCAAKSSLWGSYKSFYNSNVTGTQNVVDACIKNNVKKLVHVSSPSIYFEFSDKFDIKETDKLPKKFVNYYAKTKYLSECVVDEGIKNGLNAIIIRPRAIFGAGDTALIPRLIRANAEKFIPKTVKNDILIDITHVKNVVESMILAMNADKKFNGQKYNITNGENIKFYSCIENLITNLGMKYNSKNISYCAVMLIASFLEFIYKFLPNKEPVFTKYSVGLISFNQTLDISKAKNELGYKPVISVEEGFKEVANAYKENY